MTPRLRQASATAVLAIGIVFTSGVARATAPPVGPLPRGQVTDVATRAGSLIAIALPPATRAGFVWRLARPVDPALAVQVSEGIVGRSAVVVFRTKGMGHTSIAFGLTRGERPTAIQAVTYRLTVTGR